MQGGDRGTDRGGWRRRAPRDQAWGDSWSVHLVHRKLLLHGSHRRARLRARLQGPLAGGGAAGGQQAAPKGGRGRVRQRGRRLRLQAVLWDHESGRVGPWSSQRLSKDALLQVPQQVRVPHEVNCGKYKLFDCCCQNHLYEMRFLWAYYMYVRLNCFLWWEYRVLVKYINCRDES